MIAARRWPTRVKLPLAKVAEAIAWYGIDVDKANPLYA